MVVFVGPPLFASVAAGGGTTRIATLFPQAKTIVTLPGIHATQRQAFVEHQNAQRAGFGQPPLDDDEQTAAWLNAVDLIVEGDEVLIRPDPERMDLAFEADSLLQDITPKRQIRFLFAEEPRVREAIIRRGEAWRIQPLPKSKEEIKARITSHHVAVRSRAIYYYSVLRGTRLLTYAEFAGLTALEDDALRMQLIEIRELAGRRNAAGWPEFALFMAAPDFSPELLAAPDWANLSPADLRAEHKRLCAAFAAAVPPPYQHDDVEDGEWRRRMYAALIGHASDELSESDLLGLAAEFYMQVQWLPGARIDEGEILFDACTEDAAPGDEQQSTMVRNLICNLMQEFGDMEFINIGRVIASLSKRAVSTGRREVYVAHLRQRGAIQDTLQIIRMQKWGVREHLEEGKDLLRAMTESEEYTDYIMDRRLGCRQLGMNLPPRVWSRKITEHFPPNDPDGVTIWSPYFQRNFIAGFASDKLPPHKLRDPEYAVQLAHVLGHAAAPNMIVGRCDPNSQPVFDDGDEVIVESASGLPATILVADHTGTFVDYDSPLTRFAPGYAEVVNRRRKLVPNPQAFADAFLSAFTARFHLIQLEYRTKLRAFDRLFSHRKCDPGGSFAWRWKLVLSRLEKSDPDELRDAIREHIRL